MLKNCHCDNFSFADGMLVREGQGDHKFPLPARLRPLYEEVIFKHIQPRDRPLLIPQFSVKTENEIDEEWEDMLKFMQRF